MTAILLTGRLSVSVRGVSNPLSTCLPGLVGVKDALKRRDGLNAYVSEETELKEINSSHTFQKEPRNRTGRQAMDGPAVYEFKVAQSLSDQRAAWFDGLALTRDDQGNTVLSGTIVDQAALHGVLTKIRDLNLILLSVMRK
jgi:hypothetical protein